MVKIISSLILVALILVCAAYASAAATISFENCEPGTWVGGVKWIWGENGVGVYEGADYVDVPDLELKDVGTLLIDLEPGHYAITHYQPEYLVQAGDGRFVRMPPKIVEFREITVTDKPETHSFGCE